MNALMIQGTSSGAGKTILTAALCRIFSNEGYSVAPFKAQNMSNYAYKGNGFEISRAQAIQAIAARCQITPDLNPILLKPLGNYYSMVYLKGKKFKKMHANDYYKKFVNSKGIKIVKESLKTLQKNNDIVIIEGAGSPVEINLQQYDIANMKIAEMANAPVILVSDIDRGGTFASIVGTMALLNKKQQNLIQGFLINKFRGDLKILKPGFTQIKKITKKPVLGTIPMLKINIPDEDSLDSTPRSFSWNQKNTRKLDQEIENLSKIVKQNLNTKAIQRMMK